MTSVKPRGVGIRAIATVADLIVLFLVGAVIGSQVDQRFFTWGWDRVSFGLGGLPALAWILTCFGYFIVSEAQFGRTLGKAITGMWVASESGMKNGIGYRASILRNLIRLIDGLFLYLVGAIAITVSEKNQRVGDKVADTYVVSEISTGDSREMADILPTHLSWYWALIGASIALPVALLIGSTLENDQLVNTIAGLAWLAMPVATYMDSKYVEQNSDWSPRSLLWFLGMAVMPPVNYVVGIIYIFRRRKRLDPS